MTCASCANRIEKKLNQLDGITASVNYATEKAHVTGPDDLDPQTLIAEVEKTGYTAVLPSPPQSSNSEAEVESAEDAELRSLRQRLIGATVLAVPVIAMAMIPALQFDYWGFASLVLAAPVVLWAGWPFHQATWMNLKHGAATMDTLISVGTLSAMSWSIVALFFGTAGQPGGGTPVRIHDLAQRRARQHLSGGRRRGDHVHPHGSLLREALQTHCRRSPSGPCWNSARRRWQSCATAKNSRCRLRNSLSGTSS
jgi:cation transport ATPase